MVINPAGIIEAVDHEKYLLVKGKSGLGNRILFLLSALLYARLAGRSLLVDWSDPTYSGSGADIFPMLFDCPSVQPPSSLPATDSVHPSIWRRQLNRSALDMARQYRPGLEYDPDIWREFSADLSRLDYPEDILVAWCYFDQIHCFRRHLTGRYADWRRAPVKTILKTLLREELAPQAAVRDRIERFKSEHFRSGMVGVHVRYTDKRTRLRALRRRLDRLLMRSPGLRIFLTTDSAFIKAEFQTAYPGICMTPKRYPADATPMHRADHPDRPELAIEALVDMYLLAACDYLILDERSSFSYVAGLLTDAPDANVFNLQPGLWLPARFRHALWLGFHRLRRLTG